MIIIIENEVVGGAGDRFVRARLVGKGIYERRADVDRCHIRISGWNRIRLKCYDGGRLMRFRIRSQPLGTYSGRGHNEITVKICLDFFARPHFFPDHPISVLKTTSGEEGRAYFFAFRI